MKFKSIIAAGLASVMLLALTGCDAFEEEIPSRPQSSSSSSVSSNGDPSGNNSGGSPDTPGERVFKDSATQLTNLSGELTVNRRGRSDAAPMAEDGWTILVYMCGSDLESKYNAASADMMEAINADFKDDVNIVYQTGGSKKWATGISNGSITRLVRVDGDIAVADEQPDASMGERETLESFLEWGIENYPAKHMGLVFWNHGGGSISGVCFDEMHDLDSLSLREIDGALNSVYDKMTDKFEFIGFDACLMSTLETANILVPYARYMYASEESEPGCGWNYTEILNFLNKNPDADGAQLGKALCNTYYQTCSELGVGDEATLAVTDLSKLDDLLVSFNETAKQVYESENKTGISRAVYNVDNFGGNSRAAGYTNMIDLKGFLNAVYPYAPNAADTLRKLEAAISSGVNGPLHSGAGGLSMYYPLCVQGSTELSTFADIATSAYYLGFVDAMAYGTTGGDVNGYNNSFLLDDILDFWSIDYSADENIGVNDGFNEADENATIPVSGVFFDDDGIYTVSLENSDTLNYVTAALFLEFEDASLYLGEDDDVIISDDYLTLQDNFDGSWLSLGEIPLMVEVASVDENYTVYTAPVLLNGEVTNLRFMYDWNNEEFSVLDTWAGIDPETGAAARETVPLKNGDVIEPLWLALYTDGTDEYISGGEYTVNGTPEIGYEMLGDGEFSYSMTLYDIYGNYYFTPEVGFSVEDGEVYFYPEDLE